MITRLLGAAALLALFVPNAARAALSGADASLIDAVAFVLFGLEEGSDPGRGMPLKRTVKSDQIEYVQQFKHPDPSKASDPKIYSISVNIASPTACTFTAENAMDLPGDMAPPGKASTKSIAKIDLNTVTRFDTHTFKLDPSLSMASIQLEGYRVYCENDVCKDKTTFSRRGEDAKEPAMTRVSRAIDFIKKTCPGKPY